MANQQVPITMEEVIDPEELAQGGARDKALGAQLRLVTSACHQKFIRSIAVSASV